MDVQILVQYNWQNTLVLHYLYWCFSNPLKPHDPDVLLIWYILFRLLMSLSSLSLPNYGILINIYTDIINMYIFLRILIEIYFLGRFLSQVLTITILHPSSQWFSKVQFIMCIMKNLCLISSNSDFYEMSLFILIFWHRLFIIT